MSLSPEANAVVAAREAVAALLIEVVFLSTTERWWTGFGPGLTPDGKQWSGIGVIISIDGLSGALSGSAPAGRIVLSAASAQGIASAADATQYRDRPLIIYLQPFQDRVASGNPVPLALRFMKSLEFNRDAGTRTVTLNHESPYSGRRRAPAAWYSDRDQQKRHPGDRFCERVPYLLHKKDKWPYYP